MPRYYVEDYEEVTGLKREPDEEASTPQRKTKVVKADTPDAETKEA